MTTHFLCEQQATNCRCRRPDCVLKHMQLLCPNRAIIYGRSLTESMIKNKTQSTRTRTPYCIGCERQTHSPRSISREDMQKAARLSNGKKLINIVHTYGVWANVTVEFGIASFTYIQSSVPIARHLTVVPTDTAQ